MCIRLVRPVTGGEGLRLIGLGLIHCQLGKALAVPRAGTLRNSGLKSRSLAPPAVGRGQTPRERL